MVLPHDAYHGSLSLDKSSLCNNIPTKLDDIAQVNIVEDFDNRPSKKAKISESGVLEPSPRSPTMSTSSPGSECFESIVPESDNQMNHDTLSSPRSTISPVFPLHDVKEPDSHKEIKVYDYLPQDYTLTDHDLCAHIAIESSLRKELLVQIDGSSVLQHQLMCLLDKKEWVNDDVINAYVCCIKDQIHLQNDNKVYFESPFVTSLFKRDDTLGIQEDSAFMTETVLKYMQHDMIKLPINASNTHWYLAVVNTKKREVQVLDSLCWNSDRDDLANTLRGIQFHLDLLKSQNLVSDDWKDIDLTEWKITEQLQKAIQKYSSSCGLFMVKFMEYFTGCALSYPITQEMITSFRFKLASILLCWKTNTAAMTTIVEESDDDTKGDPDDVQILESLDD
nr:putative ubiquitin-like-specific protease 1B [Aegilops tauschii subsp. strangulata]